MSEKMRSFESVADRCEHGSLPANCKICTEHSETEGVPNDEIKRMLLEMKDVEISPEDRNEGGELLASPDGNVSNLPEREWRMVRTPAFKEWFKQSLVLDENDEPLILYHGSKQKFAKFDISEFPKTHQVDSGYFGRGNYFTQHEGLAKNYGPVLYRTFLRIEKLQVFDTEHGNVRYREKPFPEEIHEEIFSRYEQKRQKRIQERIAEKNKFDEEHKDNPHRGWMMVFDISEDQHFEDILSEEVTNVLKEKGYGGVLGFNPRSKLYEYAVFEGSDIMIIPEEE